MSELEEMPDYAAIERLWPQHGRRYGERGSWFAFVGYTRQQRDGLRAARVKGGPRGIQLLASGRIRTRSTVSGEFIAR